MAKKDSLSALRGWRGGEVAEEIVIPPVPLSGDTVEEVVRVLKTGLYHHPVISEENRERLNTWIKEREDELDLSAGRNPAERSGELQEEITTQETASETAQGSDAEQLYPATTDEGETTGTRLSDGSISTGGQL